MALADEPKQPTNSALVIPHPPLLWWTATRMTNDHDALFRHTFSQPEHAASLLRSILPPALARAIDWDTLRLEPGSFVDEALKSRYVDLLFTAQMGGQLVLIYVLLEHKSGTDRWTALQVLRYAVRVLDRFLVEHPDATFLPPIVPIVVHHGSRGWTSPRTVLDLVDLETLPTAVQKVLAPLQPNLHFLLDDLAIVPESQLKQRRATVLSRLTLLLLQFVRGAAERDPSEFVHRWLDLMRALWDDPLGRHALFSLFSYLAAQLEAPRDQLVAAATLIHEDARIMGKTIADQFREEGFKKGIDQGAQGKTTHMVELLLRLLHKRFGNVPPTDEERIRTASIERLDEWTERILTATTLDELFA